MVGIISVVIGDHFGGGDHFDGGDHFGGGTGRVTTVRVMFEYVSEEFEALLEMVIGLSGV